MEDNERLLQQFFDDAHVCQPLADEGFTERVMRRLPSRADWFARWWTACCVAVFAVLFVAFRGWELLAVHFEVMVRTLAVESFSINLLMLAGILFGLLLVGVEEAVSRA